VHSSLNVLGGAEVLAFSFYRKGNNKKYQMDVSQDDWVRWCTEIMLSKELHGL
jgi:hypothetical protein